MEKKKKDNFWGWVIVITFVITLNNIRSSSRTLDPFDPYTQGLFVGSFIGVALFAFGFRYMLSDIK